MIPDIDAVISAGGFARLDAVQVYIEEIAVPIVTRFADGHTTHVVVGRDGYARVVRLHVLAEEAQVRGVLAERASEAFLTVLSRIFDALRAELPTWIGVAISFTPICELRHSDCVAVPALGRACYNKRRVEVERVILAARATARHDRRHR